MIRLEFTPETIEELLHEKQYHPHPRVRQKMEVLYYKSQGMPHQEICKYSNIRGRATLARYFRQYQEGGLDRLRQLNFRKPESLLALYRNEIEAAIAEKPPATINEARHRIAEITGLERSLTAVHRFLKKKLKLNRHKTGHVPFQQAQPEHQQEQERFKEQELEPRLAEMMAGQREVFFVDAAHFVWATFLGYLWCWSRLFVLAPSGRKRFNVLGAIHAKTHQLVTVTNTTYINADSVCALLIKISDIGFQVPITLILDNARYQHARVVKDLAKQLNIELLFLPTYSPNLNLIERLWKFVKKECLNAQYYDNFDGFIEAIQACLAKVGSNDYETKLKTLLTLNFQTFKNVSLVR